MPPSPAVLGSRKGRGVPPRPIVLDSPPNIVVSGETPQVPQITFEVDDTQSQLPTPSSLSSMPHGGSILDMSGQKSTGTASLVAPNTRSTFASQTLAMGSTLSLVASNQHLSAALASAKAGMSNSGQLAPIKQKQHQDRFRLRYLKFKCAHVTKTIEFYQALGMTLEWRADNSSGNVKEDENPPPQPHGKIRLADTRQKAKHDVSAAAAKAAEPTVSKTIFAMAFHNTNKDSMNGGGAAGKMLESKVLGGAWGNALRQLMAVPTTITEGIDGVQLVFENIQKSEPEAPSSVPLSSLAKGNKAPFNLSSLTPKPPLVPNSTDSTANPVVSISVSPRRDQSRPLREYIIQETENEESSNSHGVEGRESEVPDKLETRITHESMIKQNEVAMEPTKKSSEQGDAITNSVDENDSQDLDEPSESTATSTSKTNPLSFLFSMMTKGGATLAKKAHAYEYIVFYVRFLARVTKRLQSKGYDVQMMNVTVPEMKMAVTTDPNGIEVRLMELTDLQLADDPGKTPWFGRLAYYTIPTDYAVETVRRLERLFGTHPPHYHAVARVRKAGGVTSKFPGGNSSNSGASSFNTGFPTTIDQLLALSSTISVATGLRSPPIAFGSTGDPKGGGMYGTKNLFTVGKGFRLVDTEDISVGLSRIVYYWMGNDLRNNACTVCFSQKSDSNSPAATSQQYRSKSKLLAIGFETNNIDQAITLLKYEELPWEEAKLKLKDVGLFARFPDQLNNIHVELFAPVQKEEPAQKGKGAGKLSQKRFGVHYGTEEDEERAMKDEEERHRLRHEAVFEVSTKHLKGHVRSWLSEGVIHEVRTTEESEQLKKRPSSSM